MDTGCSTLYNVLNYESLCVFQSIASTEPTSQDAKPQVQPGVSPPFYITDVGVNPGLNPGFGVLSCGPWSEAPRGQLRSLT
jgi:hypothetical protein